MSTNTETQNETPAFDRITTECLATPFTEWNPNLMAVYVHRLEDAFCEKLKGPMVSVNDELSALFEYVFRSAPPEVCAGITSDNGDAGLRAAYLLGQLSFAQQFAGHVAHHRPDDEFYAEFKDEQTKKILACLVSADRTKMEIATSARLALATVETKMRKLLGLGIAEFRMRFGAGEPGVSEYFLTHAAKAMLQERTQA